MKRKVLLSECVEYMIKGPFGSDMKKSLYVPKGNNAYKVYIQANAIQQNEKLGEYYVSEQYFHEKLERFEVHSGDYIITCDGTLGKHLKLSSELEKGVISSSLLLLKLKDDIIYDKYFELLWDYQILPYLASQARNACLIHLPSAKAIGEVEIKLPSIEEQKEFAIKAYKIQNVCKHRLHELELLDNLIKGRFSEMFESKAHERISVNDLCSHIVDCPHSTPRYDGPKKNPAIRTSEIKKGYITWDSMRYVSDEEYEERVTRLRPQKGDIVYAREGTFGNAAILPDGYKFCLGQRVMLLRPNLQLCTPEYLLHALLSDDVYKQALEKNNASTVAHINVKDVKSFMISLPPMDIQRNFTALLVRVEDLKSTIRKTIQEERVLFDSLIQQYYG